MKATILAQTPTLTDWVQAIGAIAAAWVGVGALLVDRRARIRADQNRKRDIHAWVRYVDDDDRVAPAWTLFVTNSAGVPIETWCLLFSSNKTIGGDDLGPLAPGTLTRNIGVGDASERPGVSALVFRDPDGVIVLKHTYSQFKEIQVWPDWAELDS